MTFNEQFAAHIAASSLEGARNPINRSLRADYLQWTEGRANAVQTPFPTVENIAAHNEVKFLANDYWPRHRRTI
jgi:hypothetical protein